MPQAALHDMNALPVTRTGTGKPWKHHVVVNGRSACMAYPIRADTLKPATAVHEWNRCRTRACAIRWPKPDTEERS